MLVQSPTTERLLGEADVTWNWLREGISGVLVQSPTTERLLGEADVTWNWLRGGDLLGAGPVSLPVEAVGRGGCYLNLAERRGSLGCWSSPPPRRGSWERRMLPGIGCEAGISGVLVQSLSP